MIAASIERPGRGSGRNQEVRVVPDAGDAAAKNLRSGEADERSPRRTSPGTTSSWEVARTSSRTSLSEFGSTSPTRDRRRQHDSPGDVRYGPAERSAMTPRRPSPPRAETARPLERLRPAPAYGRAARSEEMKGGDDRRDHVDDGQRGADGQPADGSRSRRSAGRRPAAIQARTRAASPGSRSGDWAVYPRQRIPVHDVEATAADAREATVRRLRRPPRRRPPFVTGGGSPPRARQRAAPGRHGRRNKPRDGMPAFTTCERSGQSPRAPTTRARPSRRSRIALRECAREQPGRVGRARPAIDTCKVRADSRSGR